MTIQRDSSLSEVAFIVATALENAGVTAVLTGGSAATYYAPRAYQSRDIDFIIQFAAGDGRAHAAASLKALGYKERGQQYLHPKNPLTLEFPAGPLAIGDELLRDWSTVKKRGMTLHLLSATDCVRDRMLWFYLQPTDRSSLAAAVAVASSHRIDIDLIRRWSEREGFSEKFDEFQRHRR